MSRELWVRVWKHVFGFVLALVTTLAVAFTAVPAPAASASPPYDVPYSTYDEPVDVAQSLMVAAADLVVPTDGVENAVFPAPQSVGYLYGSSADLVAPSATRFGPANPGPLDDSVAATFRSASYDEVVLSQDTLLYRVYGGQAGPIGGYWSRTPPSGPMQAQIDLALNPQWGNLATDVATIRVPAGTTIYEGAAAAQFLPGGGTLLGGGNQVFIPNVNSGWLVGG
jgi:hypothetical protein